MISHRTVLNALYSKVNRFYRQVSVFAFALTGPKLFAINSRRGLSMLAAIAFTLGTPAISVADIWGVWKAKSVRVMANGQWHDALPDGIYAWKAPRFLVDARNVQKLEVTWEPTAIGSSWADFCMHPALLDSNGNPPDGTYLPWAQLFVKNVTNGFKPMGNPEIIGSAGNQVKHVFENIPSAYNFTVRFSCRRFQYDDMMYSATDNISVRPAIVKKEESYLKVLPSSESDSGQAKDKQGLADSSVKLASARTLGTRLTLKLSHQGDKTMRFQKVELRPPGRTKAVWSKRLSLAPGKEQTVPVELTSLDLPSSGMHRLNVFVNGRKIGTARIPTGLAGRGTSPSPFRSAKKSVGQGRPGVKAVGKPTSLAAVQRKPSFKVTLSTRASLPKAGDKVTLSLGIKNTGKVKADMATSYSLRCTPSCPFTKTRGELSRKGMAPGASHSISLTSKALSAGKYKISVNTQYGGSSLTLKVVAVLQRRVTPGRTREGSHPSTDRFRRNQEPVPE